VIVLDTHVLIWWVNGDAALSKRAKTLIEREQDTGEIVVSSISAWEIATLVRYRRLSLSIDVGVWLRTAMQIRGLRFAPVDVAVAMQSVDLPGDFHKDSADRMIVATSRLLGASLVTKDEKIRAYLHVKTIW
jgi:PIN domain nuclease of toxin-antitoxin system